MAEFTQVVSDRLASGRRERDSASALSSLAVTLVSSGARTQSGAAFQTQAGLVLVGLRQGAGSPWCLCDAVSSY